MVSFEGTSHKKMQDTAGYRFFYFLFFFNKNQRLHEQILFYYNFLEPYSASSAKNIEYIKNISPPIFIS